jgi:hypothetical protein
MVSEADIIAAWRTIDMLRLSPEDALRDMRPALCEIRDNLEIILS